MRRKRTPKDAGHSYKAWSSGLRAWLLSKYDHRVWQRGGGAANVSKVDPAADRQLVLGLLPKE